MAMELRPWAPLLLATLGLAVAASSSSCAARSGRVSAGEPSAVEAGKRVYRRHGVTCHGRAGDADTQAARFLDPRPRDFTQGVYKFRTTPSGELPTDDDLLRTITSGVPGTAMPAWGDRLGEEDRRAVVQYVKTFSDDFADWGPPEPLTFPPPPELTDAMAAAGREVFVEMKCAECHGDQGRGDGPSARQLKDDFGHRIAPANLHNPRLKGGGGPTDIYRTFHTGLSGTPMPSYEGLMTTEEAWALVAYVRSLQRSPAADWLVGHRGVWE